MLVYWKVGSHPAFVGENIEFFRVSWGGTSWDKDPEGRWWGVRHPNGRRNIRLMGQPEEYGEVVEEPAPDGSILLNEIEVGKPTLDVFDEEE